MSLSHCEEGLLCGVYLFTSGLASVIDGANVLAAAILPPLLFGTIALAPVALPLWLDARELGSWRAALAKALRETKTVIAHDPFAFLKFVAVYSAYVLFFGSLFLASLGVQTWWHD